MKSKLWESKCLLLEHFKLEDYGIDISVLFQSMTHAYNHECEVCNIYGMDHKDTVYTSISNWLCGNSVPVRDGVVSQKLRHSLQYELIL